MTRKPKTQTQIATFIAKLYSILMNQQNHEIISWSICGRYFIIKSIIRLQNQILPLIFRHNNLNSFIRQLNMYDFHKTRKDHIDKLCFANKLFIKGDIEKLCEIKRKSGGIKEKDNNKENRFSQYSLSKQQDEEFKIEKTKKKVKFQLDYVEKSTQSTSKQPVQQNFQNPESKAEINSLKQTNDQIMSSFRFICSKVSIQFNVFKLDSMKNILGLSSQHQIGQIKCYQVQQQMRFLKQRQNQPQYYYETLQFLQNDNNERSYKINQDNQDNLSISCDEQPENQQNPQRINQMIENQFNQKQKKYHHQEIIIGSLSHFIDL